MKSEWHLGNTVRSHIWLWSCLAFHRGLITRARKVTYQYHSKEDKVKHLTSLDQGVGYGHAERALWSISLCLYHACQNRNPQQVQTLTGAWVNGKKSENHDVPRTVHPFCHATWTFLFALGKTWTANKNIDIKSTYDFPGSALEAGSLSELKNNRQSKKCYTLIHLHLPADDNGIKDILVRVLVLNVDTLSFASLRTRSTDILGAYNSEALIHNRP